MLSVVVVTYSLCDLQHYVKVHPDIRCISYFLSFVLHKSKDILKFRLYPLFTYHYTKESFFCLIRKFFEVKKTVILHIL